jgi:hypothetical protein
VCFREYVYIGDGVNACISLFMLACKNFVNNVVNKANEAVIDKPL